VDYERLGFPKQYKGPRLLTSKNASSTIITMKFIYFLGFSALTFVSVVTGFPEYGSLAGLSIEERDLIISSLQVRQADPPPGPLNDRSAKLVNDKDHPWEPLQPGDIRGPCPGLNTLASHGVHPAQNPITFSV
jgi:hypothetical protein